MFEDIIQLHIDHINDDRKEICHVVINTMKILL